MALQDYGSCSYTMHHHNQLGTYIIRTTWKLAFTFLKLLKYSGLKDSTRFTCGWRT